MKVKYLLAAGVAVLTLGLSSCSEGLLDIERHGAQPADNFYKTDEDAQAAVAAIYRTAWTLYSTNHGEMFLIKNLLSDDSYCGGLQRNDQSLYENINEYTFESSNKYLLSYFQIFYNVIYRCNLIISNFSDSADSQIKKNAVAQAKVWRAWSYMELITLWGRVPLVDHPLEVNEYQQGNGDPDQLWGLVISDLTEAINSGALESKANANDKVASATTGFAQALLGKSYVYMTYSLAGGINGGQDAINAVSAAKTSPYWKNAVEALDKVINSNQYALYQGPFKDIYNSVSDWNSENIFEWNRIYNSSNTSTNLSTAFESYMIGWDNANMTGYGDILPCNRASNFLTPRKELYDAMVAWQGADNPRTLGSVVSYEQAVNLMGCGVLMGPHTMYAVDGVFDIKFFRDEHKDCITSHATDKDYPLMRYAEVLLLAAEANLMVGNQAKADQYMNEVRARVGLDPLTNVTLSDIQIEKRCELYNEGQRRYDIIRWGLASELMKDQGSDVPYFTAYTESVERDADGNLVKLNSICEGTITYEGETYVLGIDNRPINESMPHGFVAGKHELLPFPHQEYLLSGEIVGGPLVQNPGY